MSFTGESGPKLTGRCSLTRRLIDLGVPVGASALGAAAQCCQAARPVQTSCIRRSSRVNTKLAKNGLIAAALMNIGGVLLLSRAFTNVAINDADPVVMSNFGLLMIAVWGLAYLGAATVGQGDGSSARQGPCGHCQTTCGEPRRCCCSWRWLWRAARRLGSITAGPAWPAASAYQDTCHRAPCPRSGGVFQRHRPRLADSHE